MSEKRNEVLDALEVAAAHVRVGEHHKALDLLHRVTELLVELHCAEQRAAIQEKFTKLRKELRERSQA